jgi:NAD(P)-dependent dehydrogenase (short-subunit alcohol dehydrogenase family)
MTTQAANTHVALVTGASSGMGKAFAKALLAEGMTVYAAARRLEQMADLASLGAVALKMDITQQDEVQAAVQRIEQARGEVDVLINIAGFGLYGAMEVTNLDDARYQFEVNLFGMARLTQKETHQLWIVKSPCE